MKGDLRPESEVIEDGGTNGSESAAAQGRIEERLSKLPLSESSAAQCPMNFAALLSALLTVYCGLAIGCAVAFAKTVKWELGGCGDAVEKRFRVSRCVNDPFTQRPRNERNASLNLPVGSGALLCPRVCVLLWFLVP
ncbi:hypothetical protein TRVL_04299 [Trypanosoma vivax]|nr:hypothetical protein TRVL_04299 [Trypanosoma vivax]